MASALRALGRDLPFRLLVGLTAVLCLPYFVPILDPVRLEAWAIDYFSVVFLGLVFAGLGHQRSKIVRPGEREFWRLLQIAAGVLWTVRCLLAFAPARSFDTAANLLVDVAYLGFYATVVYAASLAPHKERHAPAGPSNRIQALAVVVTLAALVTYFVLIPAQINPQRYGTWVPSLYLFFVLDLILVYLFLKLRRDSRGGTWAAVYGALAVTSGLWALADLVESLQVGGAVRLPIGTPLELIWVLPGLALVSSLRLRLRLGDADAARVVRVAERPLARGFALVAVVALPTLDFAFHRLAALDPAMRSARGTTVIVALLMLGGLAWLERRHLRRERAAARRRHTLQETRLREGEARFRALFEHAPDAIVILDPQEGRFVDANPSAEQLFGLSRDELLRLGPVDVSPRVQPDGRRSEEVVRSTLEAVLAGRNEDVEYIHERADGRPVHCEIHLSRLPEGGREMVRASIVDVTQSRRLEAELVQAQKMESIGRLAGGVAHDFNNLLTVIGGYANQLLALPGLRDDLSDPLQEIAGAARRAERLTGQLLAFSRKQVLGTETVDVNHILEEMSLMLERLIGENVALTTELSPSPCLVRVNRGHLEQAIVNLAVNGQDAMPSGGRLVFATSVVPSAETAARSSDAGWVEVRVTDSGVGMDPETLARAFDPFFTTKELGKGTGLGLSTVYGFAQRSGGAVTATSEPGKGATFCLRLPRFAGPAPEADAEEPEAAADVHPAGTILLVEDEDAVRDLVQGVLEEKGYRVVAASSTAEARDRLQGLDSGIDLLLTDMVLSQGTGLDLARELRSELPDLPTLLISGYADEMLSPEALSNEKISFLGKPFTPAALLAEVRQAISAGPVTNAG